MPHHAHSRPPHRRPPVQRSLALALVALLMVAIAASASAAPGKTRQRAKAPRHIGATVATLNVEMSRHDSRAIRALRRSNRLLGKAEQRRDEASRFQQRIDQIELLIEQAQGDEQALREQLATELVTRYRDSSAHGLDFLLASESLSEVVGRAHALRARITQQQALARSHELSLERLEELQAVLERLRDQRSSQALQLEESAALLNDVVVTAADTHVESEVDVKLPDDAGAPGQWFLTSDGSLLSGLLSAAYNGAFGTSYDGGTTTPRRASTPEQVSRVLGDPRIQVYPGGVGDIERGAIDGRVLDALTMMAERFGSIVITSLQTGHGYLTASGNVSEHAFGCAADIGTVQGTLITPSAQGPGSVTEQAVRFLAGLQGDLAPHQVISLYPYGGPTLGMPDHGDHIHLGYAC